MIDTIQKMKGPLIIIAILFAGFFVYNSSVKTPAPTTALQKGNKVAAEKVPEQDFLPLLLRIQSVTLDERLFLNPVFRTLKDYTQPIIPENAGKANPFTAQISSSVVSSVESLGFSDAEVKAPVKAAAPVKKSAIKK
jgi:hypothetical protein